MYLQEMTNKKEKGQFYTTNCDYILEGLKIPENIENIIEPFTGQGDLINWARKNGYTKSIKEYDIEPKRPETEQRDTLKNPPDYTNFFILTNPPFLARNKTENKEIYNLYNTNDIYKCFLSSIKDCQGGIIIIPAGFFLSPRSLDIKCRNQFMRKYKIIKVRYFEETVFNDTTTTVVSILFKKSEKELQEQDVEWEILPSKITRIFKMSSKFNWIIGGEIYHLPIDKNVVVSRHIKGQKIKENQQQTFITLNALDNGKNRINLSYKKNFVYQAKDTSRTYATLRINNKVLTEEEQEKLCERFNNFVEEKRKETHSLFLPQYREAKEYARKRIPFSLVYNILNYLMVSNQLK